MADALTNFLDKLMVEPSKSRIVTRDHSILKKDVVDCFDWLFKRAQLSDGRISELRIRRNADDPDGLLLVPILQACSGSTGRPKLINPWFFGAVMKNRLTLESSNASAIAGAVHADYQRVRKLIRAESTFVPVVPSRRGLRNLSSRCPAPPKNIPPTIIPTIDSLVVALVRSPSR
jgi:hypothetical protein